MSTRTVTVTNTKNDEIKKETEHFLTKVSDEVKKALSEETAFWSGIQWFLDWLRAKVSNFLRETLQNIPVIGRYASRISVSVSEFCFTVIGTMIHLLKVVFSSPQTWKAAHNAAMAAWTANENRGIVAQCYAYGKKMAGYFLEILMQCLERAIKNHGLEVSQEEKNDINKLLNDLLQ